MIRRGPRKASSMGVIVDSQLPHLVGIDDDILSTGVIIYHIKVCLLLLMESRVRKLLLLGFKTWKTP